EERDAPRGALFRRRRARPSRSLRARRVRRAEVDVDLATLSRPQIELHLLRLRARWIVDGELLRSRVDDPSFAFAARVRRRDDRRLLRRAPIAAANADDDARDRRAEILRPRSAFVAK